MSNSSWKELTRIANLFYLKFHKLFGTRIAYFLECDQQKQFYSPLSKKK